MSSLSKETLEDFQDPISVLILTLSERVLSPRHEEVAELSERVCMFLWELHIEFTLLPFLHGLRNCWIRVRMNVQRKKERKKRDTVNGMDWKMQSAKLKRQKGKRLIQISICWLYKGVETTCKVSSFQEGEKEILKLWI